MAGNVGGPGVLQPKGRAVHNALVEKESGGLDIEASISALASSGYRGRIPHPPSQGSITVL